MVQADADSFLNIHTRQQLADYLSIDLKELTFFAFSGKTFYRDFAILKNNGIDRRIISSPKAKLMSIQKTLADTLECIYQPPASVHGFVKSKSTATNALPHVKAKGILKIDIKDFFPSITAGRVRGLFLSSPFSFPAEVADTLTNLVSHNQSLPQGAPTSPIISNMICLSMDKTLLNFSRKHMLKYTRYADDLTFSSTSKRAISQTYSEDAHGNIVASKDLCGIINKNGFEINHSKTTFMGSETRQTVTGIVVNKKCNFRRSDYRYYRNLFHRWKKQGAEPAAKHYLQHERRVKYRQVFYSEDEEFSETRFRNHIRGMLSYFSMIASINDRESTPLQKLWTSYYDITKEAVPVMIPERSVFQTDAVYDYRKSGSSDAHIFACTGTAFLLKGIGFITAKHCVKPARDLHPLLDETPSVEIRAHGLSFNLQIESAIDGIDDWCVFPSLPSSHPQPGLSSASTFDLQRGVKVIALGYAEGGRQLRRIEATVTEVFGDEVVVDRAFVQGMSGGPVLNSRGKVLGIVTKGSEVGSYNRDGRFLLLSSILRGYDPLKFAHKESGGSKVSSAEQKEKC